MGHEILFCNIFRVISLLFEILHRDLDVIYFNLLEQVINEIVNLVGHEHTQF